MDTYHTLFIHSYLNGHVDGFHILVINREGKYLFHVRGFFSLGAYLSRETNGLDQKVALFLVSRAISTVFSIGAVLIDGFTSNA